MAYIYRHIRVDKNEPFYIGIGSDSKGKYERAFDYSHRHSFWKNIVNKTEYEVEILMDEIDWECACKKEKEFIAMHGRRNLGKGTLVNLTDGGDGNNGAILSEESKNKIRLKAMGNKNSVGRSCEASERKRRSDVMKGNKYALGSKRTAEQLERSRTGNVNNSWIGRHHSPETIAKLMGNKNGLGRKVSDELRSRISAALKGRKLSEETKSKMRGKRGKYKKNK
jgi:hypothetical protein